MASDGNIDVHVLVCRLLCRCENRLCFACPGMSCTSGGCRPEIKMWQNGPPPSNHTAMAERRPTPHPEDRNCGLATSLMHLAAHLARAQAPALSASDAVSPRHCSHQLHAWLSQALRFLACGIRARGLGGASRSLPSTAHGKWYSLSIYIHICIWSQVAVYFAGLGF